MSLFDPNVRLAVLRLRNGRMLDDQANISIGRMMDNRRFSRADGDAMNDREDDFGYKQGETAEDLQDGDMVNNQGSGLAQSRRRRRRVADAEQERREIEAQRRRQRETDDENQDEIERDEFARLDFQRYAGMDAEPRNPRGIAVIVDTNNKKSGEEKVGAVGSQEEGSKKGKKGKGKRQQSDKMKRRTALVKKLMREKGMKMIEASKYIKANNMKY